MRFWDSSAIVPLLIEEPTTEALRRAISEDPQMAVWWATPVECVSAIVRRERSGLLPSSARSAGVARLTALAPTWDVIGPTVEIREAAIRLLQTHDLRAADALQLAAAFAAAEGHPPTLEFISLDQRLNEAALREGFRLAEIEK